VAVREIVKFPTPSLRLKAKPVQVFDKDFQTLVDDMIETMREAPGVGPAPQIGAHSRVVVVRLGGGPGSEREPDAPMPLINPTIIEARDERRDFDGCLSIPGLYGETVRPHYLRVKGLNMAGRVFDRVFEGFDAVVVHHELDHLEGVLFIDRVESLEYLYRVVEGDDGQLVRIPLTPVTRSE